MLCELKPADFTEFLTPIFRVIETEVGGSFQPDHFYPWWRKLMECGVARAWENDGCVIGSLFVPDGFCGELRALVYFWFSAPRARGTGRPIELLDAFEKAARDAGCRRISISSHMKVATDKTARIYEKRGYSLTERIFTKEL